LRAEAGRLRQELQAASTRSTEGTVLKGAARLDTAKKYQPPVEITIVAKTDSTNLRLAYAADQIIFNWELDPSQLRVDGGPADGRHKAGAGHIPPGKFVTIRWVVTSTHQAIYADGELRFEHQGDYSHINRCVTVFPEVGSVVTVKSINVKQIPDDPVDSQSREATPENLDPAMMSADPAAALAYAGKLSPADRRKFLDAAFIAWAKDDTDAALKWIDEHLSDPTDKDAAMQAIRSVAPVGIGAQLALQDGYAVIDRLFPGTPAELSGQLHPGDRILAVAQGDDAFVDAHNIPLGEMVQAIRGAPGTLIQLQVLPADAPPDSLPKTVTLSRGQIKYKR
jgi:hypothetical protein